MRIVVDSYAWIEIFLGSDEGQSASLKLQDAELVMTPDVVLAEIARKYLREGAREQVVKSRLRTIAEGSELCRIDESIAIACGKVYIEIQDKAKRERIPKPSLFDAIVLATARINDAKVLTGDQHFRNLPETIWLKSISS